jgi:hypothetical protein
MGAGRGPRREWWEGSVASERKLHEVISSFPNGLFGLRPSYLKMVIDASSARRV